MSKYHPLYLAFFRHYHRGEYWEAHEVLEELWQTQRHNDFYHGLIQVAAVMHQLGCGKIRGARKLATSALGYFQNYGDQVEGVDLKKVRIWLERCLEVLPEDVGQVPPHEVQAYSLAVCPLPQTEELNREI